VTSSFVIIVFLLLGYSLAFGI